eukprot:TRINITY_DN5527_c0_g1_i3.p1 TRINITY_DN5527_c0_g1~~TRINITY_DN5527_c0_g1_i3.p1  ORF type:complete len:144 (+),score=46.18 TRINITY_DN5527_c0_g1_i3:61-432(+)
MNAFKVLAFLALVAVAASVTVRGCGTESGNSINLDWGKCTQHADKQGYTKLILVSGTLAGKNATATMQSYQATDATCSGVHDDFTANCSCDYTDAAIRLECGTAAGVIPSVLLIIAAIMAHLF